MKAMLAKGEIAVSDPKAQAFGLLLSTADHVATTINALSWVVLRAEAGEFVTSDRAIAMYDPTPRFPWSGHAWLSSPGAQSTMPLDPAHCLLLEPGPARIGQGNSMP